MGALGHAGHTTAPLLRPTITKPEASRRHSNFCEPSPVPVQVAETNPAAALYGRSGFQVTKCTRSDWSAPFMARVLHWFLGFPHWHRMVKARALPAACMHCHSGGLAAV